MRGGLLMKAGRARSRIVIQERPSNGQFEAREEWTTIHTAKAIKKHKSGGESEKESGTTDYSKVEFQTRYRDNIKRTHRLLEGGDIYEIEDIRNVGEKNINMVLICERRNRF
jgi:head-tail adaptor